MEINFYNVPVKYQSTIKKTINDFIKKHQLNPRVSINISFVPKTKIQTLNKKYRKVDQPTDVLSFPIWDNLKNIPPKGEVALGDIFIYPAGSAKGKKLTNLVNHSLNHLIGKHH